MTGANSTQIDREPRRMSPAIAREKSAVERIDSGTHLTHKTRLEKRVSAGY